MSAGDRIATLDVLRGFAILGILLVNILYFANVSTGVDNWGWDGSDVWNSVAHVFIEFFATLKFMTLFSILFGMGLAIQNERALARSQPFAGMYARRLSLLLVFGLLHGTLLWYGDILFLYAALGFVALLCRNAKPRSLLIAAVILFVVPMVAIGGLGAVAPGLLEQGAGGDWSDMVAEVRAERGLEAGAPVPSEMSELRFLEFMAGEEGIYQSGSWSDMALHRAVTFAIVSVTANFPIFGWRCLSMFFLGMSLIKWGVFRKGAERQDVFRGLVFWGVLVGIPLETASLWFRLQGMEEGGELAANIVLLYAGSLGMSLAYAGGIALLCHRETGARLLKPLAAVGRMALSNYLGQSIVCGLVFYGYGLGLFGRVGAAGSLAIVFGVFLGQIALSSFWLRYFRFGPFEWLWRSLTYWRMQPVRVACS